MKLNRQRRAKAGMKALIEALESRQLLSVDLSGVFTGTPVAALSGSKQPLTVIVSNNGDAKLTGMLTMAFYAQLDGSPFDINTAKLLIAVTRAAAITPLGGSQNFTVSVPISPALPAGNYRLYDVLDSAGKITETDETNNLVTSTVVGIVQPNYDLTAAFGPTATLVPSVVTGVSTNAMLPIILTNPGSSSVTIPAGVSVAVEVVARPVGEVGTSDDIVLNRSPLNVPVGGLARGKSHAASVPIQFPGNMSSGDFDIIVKVDTGNALAETNETNNEGTFAHTVSDAAAFSDPALSFNHAVTIPAAVVADNRPLPLKIDITNEGNTRIPAGATGSISIVAHGIADIPLKTFTVVLGGLLPGQVRTFPLTPRILAGLANGDYSIEASFTSVIPGDDAGNNTDTANGTMTVGPAFYNLTAIAPTTQIPPALLAGTPTPGFVTVGIKNSSNTLLPAGTRASIALVLRPVDELDTLNDIPVGGTSVTIGGLPVGGVQTFHVGVTIPAVLANSGLPVPLGNYNLVSIVTPLTAPVTTENITADNTAVGAPITIANEFTDLAITSASTNFSIPSAPGTTATGTTVLRNTGNKRFQGNVTIQYFATPTSNVNDGFSIGSSTFAVNLLPGQSSVPLNAALTLTTPANGFLASQYTVYARIDPSTFSDADGGNNQLQAGALTVSSQHVNLRIVSADNPFPSVVGPNQTATAHVVIGNFGSGISSGLVTINYYITHSTTLDGTQILIGTKDVMVTLGAAQLTTPVDVDLTMTNQPASSTFNILAQITTTLAVDNVPGDNVTTVIGTVNYVGP